MHSKGGPLRVQNEVRPRRMQNEVRPHMIEVQPTVGRRNEICFLSLCALVLNSQTINLIAWNHVMISLFRGVADSHLEVMVLFKNSI